MNKPALKSYRYGHHSKARLNHLKSDKIQYNSINKFLEIENSTFNFIKPLALLFFTLNAGVMAALFNIHIRQWYIHRSYFFTTLYITFQKIY